MGIGKHAFQDCSSLTSVALPAGLTRICEWAFCDCSALTSIEDAGDDDDLAVRFAPGISRLSEMGFSDTDANLSALIATNGDINAAVEQLMQLAQAGSS